MLSINENNKLSSESPEKKGKSGPSRFEVFLLLMPLLRQTVFLRRIGGTYTTIDAFSLFDIAAIFLICFYLLCVFYRFSWQKLFASCMGWLFIYYFFCIFSFMWRLEGTSVLYILYRAISMNVMLLYIFYLMSRFQNQKDAFDGLLKYVCLILFFGFIGAIRIGGFSQLHTNSYSFTAAVLAVLAITSIKVEEKTFSQVVLYLFLGLAGIILGTSGGSNVAFAMALCFILCIRKEGVNPLLVMLLPIIGILIYEFLLPELIQLLFPGKTTAGIMSGTGRMKMWAVYLDAWLQSPWLGYGFSVGERAGSAFGYIYTLSVHNGYISVLINTGIAGAFFFGMFILSSLLGMLKQMAMGNKTVFPVISAFIVIMVNNMSVPVIGSQWGALSTVVLLVGSYFALFCQNEPKSSVETDDTAS